MRFFPALPVGALLIAISLPLGAESQLSAPDAARSLAADSSSQIPPTQKRKLMRWLTAETYLDSFIPEPTIHPSTGPHGGNVRTFYNPILAEDLAAGKSRFRKGASMVKELYRNGKDNVVGYAVMIKTRNRSGSRGEGWVFYESYGRGNNSAFYGRGISVCANCHRGGVDYLLSEFRP
jgi:hypothetical protein